MAIKNTVEAILYLKGQPLSLSVLAELAECTREDAYEALLELMEDYAHRDSALEVLEEEEGFALQLREPFIDLVPKILPPELGLGAMRTLAAIVLKGPISQADLVEFRGSGAYHHVSELVEKGFISRHKQPGNRSSILHVTDKCRQQYAVSNMVNDSEDLEELPADRQEEIDLS